MADPGVLAAHAAASAWTAEDDIEIRLEGRAAVRTAPARRPGAGRRGPIG
jgi:hypothetical protein